MIPINDLTNIKNYINSNINPRRCQEDVFKKLITCDKGIASMITGSGKSIAEYGLINYAFNNGNNLNCIVSDSILLGQQLALDYLNHKYLDTKIIIFNSGKIEKLEHFNKWLEDTHDIKDAKALSNEKFEELQKEYDNCVENEDIYNEQLEEIKHHNAIETTLNVGNIKYDEKVLIISTYQSFPKLLNLNFGTIIFDEAHRGTSLEFQSHLSKLNAKNRYFFTSTPKGSSDDNTGMGNSEIYGDIVYELKCREAIDDKIIIPPAITHMVNTEYDDDFTNSKSVSASYKFSKGLITNELNRIDNPKIVINLDKIDQVKYVFEQLIKDNLNLNIYAITSGIFKKYDYESDKIITFKSKNKVIKSAKKDNNPFVILNIKMLNVGIDLPVLTTLGLFSATDSIKTLQSIGRIMRVHPEDKDANWSYKDINYNMTKPFGLVYINISGPKKEENNEVMNKSLSFLTSEFGSLLYYLDPRQPGKKRDHKPVLPTPANVCNSEYNISIDNILLNVYTDMEEQNYANKVKNSNKEETLVLLSNFNKSILK